MYQLKVAEPFTASMSERVISDGILQIHLTAESSDGAAPLTMELLWTVPCVGIHAVWTPLTARVSSIPPDWSAPFGFNCMHSAPVLSALDYSDNNRMTVACADAKNAVKIKCGIIEETGDLDCRVSIDIRSAVAHYETDVRIDTRDIKFYKSVEDVAAWWESYDGYTPADVPDDAKMPLYSAWYSYHQQIDVPAIIEECRQFAKVGCRVLIVDDGWQTDDNSRGYDYCGDWKPTTAKVPDMKAFVDSVHEAGMKFMLWYSVPFVGEYTEAYERFKDKMLRHDRSKTHIVDPRYPEIREYLITLYKNAVIDWGLDGFKLDFVDSFYDSDVVREGMDYISVYDAVDRLFKDLVAELRTLKPDILIEFRQAYIGPLMRTFGNMFRAGDCPADSCTNRLSTLALRMTARTSAVHSDMVMWSYRETAEQAAYQLTNVLFAVPQISTRWHTMTEDQKKMTAAYTALWLKYRDTLLNGEMLYRGHINHYPYVSARSADTQVGAVYHSRTAYIEVLTDEIVLVNANPEHKIFIEAAEHGAYTYEISDCMGSRVGSGHVTVGPDSLAVIGGVPENGVVVCSTVR